MCDWNKVSLFAGAFAACVFAATVTFGQESQTRNHRNFGPSQGQYEGTGGNVNHGRDAGGWDTRGAEVTKFGVRAGADGKATVRLQDVGDTKFFEKLTLNGKRIEFPEPRNRNVVEVVMDFGKPGWHAVTSRMSYGEKTARQQDGYKVCK